MNISPINPAAAYPEPPEPITHNNVRRTTSSPEPSPFRAWTRGAGQVLAGATAVNAIASHQGSEAFWTQWPEKKWRIS